MGRGRRERFDRVFEIILIIETILLEFTWTFTSTSILPIFAFSIALILWIIGTLHDGADEYLIKIVGFEASMLVLFLLLVVNLIKQPLISHEVLGASLIFSIIIIPSLFLSLCVVFYLERTIGRRKDYVKVLTATSISSICGFIVYVLLVWHF